MKIQYISDIHLEFLSKLPKIKPIADILVLAGDIGYPYSGIYKQFLIEMNQKFKKVFLITGNHEYYSAGKNINKSIEEIDDYINFLITENKLENISFLNYSYFDYEGYRFVGSTLWSKITNSKYVGNDFNIIKDMTISLYNELHEIGKEFIEETISESKLPIIMITHHLPSYKLIADEFKIGEYKDYNQMYASDCEYLMKDPIKLWIYGHTHRDSIKEINGIKLICNPKGYPSENKHKEINQVFEI